jgi:hypothetical protein
MYPLTVENEITISRRVLTKTRDVINCRKGEVVVFLSRMPLDVVINSEAALVRPRCGQ